MDKTKFKRLLFDIACLAVTCDGYIDEREVEELQHIAKSTTYFEDVDLLRKLDRFVVSFKDNPEEITESTISQLKNSLLNPIEEMLILEIILRLIYADVKIDQKEINFVKIIRNSISIDDDTIRQRFGAIDFLTNTQENVLAIKKESKSIKSMDKIDMTNFENTYFNINNKKKKK